MIPKHESHQFKSTFKKLSRYVKKLKRKDKKIYYEQLEEYTHRIRREKRIKNKEFILKIKKYRPFKQKVKKPIVRNESTHYKIKYKPIKFKKIIDIEKLKIIFELPHFSFLFKLRPTTIKSVERKIKFLEGLIEKYKAKIRYTNRKNSYLVRVFVMYSKVYSNLLLSDVESKSKRILSSKLKSIYSELKKLQKEKPKSIPKEKKIKEIPKVKIDIEH
jgi:hypothetical protein